MAFVVSNRNLESYCGLKTRLNVNKNILSIDIKYNKQSTYSIKSGQEYKSLRKANVS